MVLFNAPVQNAINAMLSDVGRVEWLNYVRANKKEVALDVMGKLSDFAFTDKNNEFFKPDLDINDALEALGTNSDFLAMTRTYAAPVDVSGMTPEEAEKALAQRKKEAEEHLGDFLKIFRDNLSTIIRAAGQLRPENPASATGGGTSVPSGTST